MFSKDLEQTIGQCYKRAREARHEFMTVDHLLLALMENASALGVLRSCGADIDRLTPPPAQTKSAPAGWRRILEGWRATPTPVRWTLAFDSLAVAGLLVLAMSGMFMGMAKSFQREGVTDKVVFGVMGVRTSQKMRELNAINDCRDAVAAMNASYSKDFQLKGKIVDAFSSMDSSYDLEKLSTLYQEEVKSPKALDCKADPSGTTSKANTERAAYDKQARTFERALTKNEANQN